jgi:hypothetical protein
MKNINRLDIYNQKNKNASYTDNVSINKILKYLEDSSAEFTADEKQPFTANPALYSIVFNENNVFLSKYQSGLMLWFTDYKPKENVEYYYVSKIPEEMLSLFDNILIDKKDYKIPEYPGEMLSEIKKLNIKSITLTRPVEENYQEETIKDTKIIDSIFKLISSGAPIEKYYRCNGTEWWYTLQFYSGDKITDEIELYQDYLRVNKTNKFFKLIKPIDVMIPGKGFAIEKLVEAIP